MVCAANVMIFCDELCDYDNMFFRYSKMPQSGKEDLLIQNS